MTSQAGQSSTVHTAANGQQIHLPPHDEFYAQLIKRNEGLISAQDQERLRRSTILVAGCGSVGGAAIEPLVRMGAERLILAEPGEYDMHNMNRQSVRLQDINRNKAEVFQERMRDINPFANITVDKRGIVMENVEAMVRDSAVILDGVDVTTQGPLKAKWALHERAKQFKVPVVSGYDVAGLQLLLTYDYRLPGTEILFSKIRKEEVDTISPMKFLRQIVPLSAIPYEMISELRKQIRGEREGFPQIVYTAMLFGVLALPAVIELLANRPINWKVMVDVPTLFRSTGSRISHYFGRLGGLYSLLGEFNRSQQGQGAAPPPAK
jgi:molybdopterin/thiamine biosynthesis adenylyltransferase